MAISAATVAVAAAGRVSLWRGPGAWGAGWLGVMSCVDMLCLLLAVRWPVCVGHRPARCLQAACGMATGAFSPLLGAVTWRSGLMNFQILGPLEARSERGPVGLGGL